MPPNKINKSDQEDEVGFHDLDVKRAHTMLLFLRRRINAFSERLIRRYNERQREQQSADGEVERETSDCL